MRSALLALFPGGLGDLLCCWPALRGLCHSGGDRLTLAARDAWLDVLPADAMTPLSIERREIADLFGRGPLADSTRQLLGGFARVESWTGSGDDTVAARLARATGGIVHVHRFRDFAAGEHATQYYARCLGVDPLLERSPISHDAARWATDWWNAQQLGDRVLAIHSGSGSTRKNWKGMAAIAAAWQAEGGQVLSLRGPAEREHPVPLPCDASICEERLARVAALLVRATAYLGNDSGISHLAGRVGARTLALFGPSDPNHWQPLGERVRVLRAPEACGQCGPQHFCTHRLAIGTVLRSLLAFVGRPQISGSAPSAARLPG